MLKRPRLIIEYDRRWAYFQWFVLGFYELKKEGLIDLSVNTNPLNKISFILDNDIVLKFIRKIYYKLERDSFYFDGYLLDSDERKITFTIDCADTPYMFDYKRLKEKDIYFKIQYPNDIDKKEFSLTKEVTIPWIDSEDVEPKLRKKITNQPRKIIEDFHDYTYKIKPLMLGPRELSVGNSYSALKRGYDNFTKAFNSVKTGKCMCYFGSSKGPHPSKTIVNPDFGLEYDLLGYYQGVLCHPNEKRYIVSKILSTDPLNDCRVISIGHADDNNATINHNLVIPLNSFPNHVSKFEYNVNVSGYTLSIPARFIDSFAVGTAIVTDKLHCKWYLPFSKEEVIETVEMGYEPKEAVNWPIFKEDIANLKKSNPKIIKEEFENKWSPISVANYIINTLKNTN